jgi:hypothetical protein
MFIKQTYQKPWQGITGIIILFFLLQTVVALFTHSMSFTQEEAMWQYIGRNWFRYGLAPYEGGADNKSPLIFGVFGLSDALLGVNNTLPRLLGGVVQCAGLYQLYKLTAHLWGQSTALLAAVLYGMVLLWPSTGGKYVSFTETYAVTAMLFSARYAFCFEGRRYLLAAGFFAAAAVLFRLQALFGLMALIAGIGMNGRRKLYPFAWGWAAGFVFIVALVWLGGVHPLQWFQYGVAGNFGAGTITNHSFDWKWKGLLHLFLRWELFLLYLPLLYFFVFVRRELFLKIWIWAEWAGIIVLGVFAYNHLKHLLPSVCIASAIVLNRFFLYRSFSPGAALVLTGIVFFPKTLEPLHGIKKALMPPSCTEASCCSAPYTMPDDLCRKCLGLWLREHTKPHETIWVAGRGAQVQAYAARQSASRYFNAVYTPEAVAQTGADLRSHPPGWIAIPVFEKKVGMQSFFLFEPDETLMRHYRYIDCKFGYRLYQKKND